MRILASSTALAGRICSPCTIEARVDSSAQIGARLKRFKNSFNELLTNTNKSCGISDVFKSSGAVK